MPAWSCITESKRLMRCGADPNGESSTWMTRMWWCSGSQPRGSATVASSSTSASGASTTKAFQ
eukprot:6700361-Heterocapsa_arctica.AAC.1